MLAKPGYFPTFKSHYVRIFQNIPFQVKVNKKFRTSDHSPWPYDLEDFAKKNNTCNNAIGHMRAKD